MVDDSVVLSRAREAREESIAGHERTIARLRVCDCAYPVVRLRNAHGHADTCPAAAMFGSAPRKRDKGAP